MIYITVKNLENFNSISYQSFLKKSEGMQYVHSLFDLLISSF